MEIYSLFDRKLREFGPLLLSNNGESIKRALRDGIPGSGSLIDKHPEDFDVMLLGAFDADSGVIVPEQVPHLLDNVAAIIRPAGLQEAGPQMVSSGGSAR